MADCFQNIVSTIEQDNRESLRCSENEDIQDGRGTSFDVNLDCLVHFTRAEALQRDEDDREGNKVDVSILKEEAALALPPGRDEFHGQLLGRRNRRRRDKRDIKSRQQAAGPTETRLVDTDDFHKLVPSDPLGLATVFCIMANLDRRERLPDLEYPKDEFYRGIPIWDEEDCSEFLPIFFPEEVKDSSSPKPAPKLFGSGSSTVER